MGRDAALLGRERGEGRGAGPLSLKPPIRGPIRQTPSPNAGGNLPLASRARLDSSIGERKSLAMLSNRRLNSRSPVGSFIDFSMAWSAVSRAEARRSEPM
jgi:hypothetical protein